MRNSDRDLRLEINQFADLTHNEFIQIKGKKSVNKINMEDDTLEDEELQDDLPTTLDWRDKNVVNPVKDQEQCGSCFAFSVAGVMESRWAIKSGTLLSLSEQEIVDCDRVNGDDGCDGGDQENVFEWLKTHELELESAYKYTATDGKCKYNKSEGKVGNISSYKVVNKTDSALINAVQSGPVSISVYAND